MLPMNENNKNVISPKVIGLEYFFCSFIKKPTNKATKKETEIIRDCKGNDK